MRMVADADEMPHANKAAQSSRPRIRMTPFPLPACSGGCAI
jgi:hypothetical protein